MRVVPFIKKEDLGEDRYEGREDRGWVGDPLSWRCL